MVYRLQFEPNLAKRKYINTPGSVYVLKHDLTLPNRNYTPINTTKNPNNNIQSIEQKRRGEKRKHKQNKKEQLILFFFFRSSQRSLPIPNNHCCLDSINLSIHDFPSLTQYLTLKRAEPKKS